MGLLQQDDYLWDLVSEARGKEKKTLLREIIAKMKAESNEEIIYMLADGVIDNLVEVMSNGNTD